MAMTEGNVYLCDKKEKGKKYFLELIENRKIKSSGECLEDCKVNICMQIIDWNGDGEAVLEFIPDKHKKMKTGTHLYTSLGYNDDINILNINDLFVGGVCKKCLYGIGKRNDELLNLERKPTNALVGTCAKPVHNETDTFYVNPTIKIYSNKFIQLLTTDERKLFDIKPILVKGKMSEYSELIPHTTITHCGHVGAEYPTHYNESWHCSECDRSLFYVFVEPYKYNHIFLDPKTINDNPTVFFVNYGSSMSLAIRNDRWAELLKYRKETKGITTNPIVVLESKYVEYPELGEFKV